MQNGTSLTRQDWLLPPSDDLAEQISELDIDSPDIWKSLRRILAHSLTPLHVNSLYRWYAGTEEPKRSALRMASVKLLFVGAATLEHIHNDMVVSALRHNVMLETKFAEFGQTAQLSFHADPDVVAFNPDIIFIYDHHNGFTTETSHLDNDSAMAIIQQRVKQNLKFAVKFKEYYGAQTMFNTVVPPIDGLVTDQDGTRAGTSISLIDSYNSHLSKAVSQTDELIFDLSHLSAMIGRWTWSNTDYWHFAKLPFHPDCNAIFADRLGSLLAAFCGTSRRALILDCDNTLWGGVIGDDGLEAIEIGQGSPRGEAHLAVQNMALKLREQGVILAVSSKNTHEICIQAFEEHPDMLLKKDDIAIYRINWSDKAANIADIAKALNLGLQSFVFLDDNPAERARVREALPEVAVPEVGSNPNDYPSFVLQAGYFNNLALNEEDKKRADMYAANAARAEALDKVDDYDSYLQSLSMKISLKPFDAVGRPRITQLISKSNQFNLTTKRYSASDVEVFEQSEKHYNLQIRLTDNFGDNGMISVVIVNKAPEKWTIDLWLMSCRVLGRRVEEYVLDHIIKAAKAENVQTIIGVFIPTERNGIVENHYKKLGFALIKGNELNETCWSLDIDKYANPGLPFSAEC